MLKLRTMNELRLKQWTKERKKEDMRKMRK